MKHEDHWIVTDATGEVHARVDSHTRSAAERMAWAILPELETGATCARQASAGGVQ